MSDDLESRQTATSGGGSLLLWGGRFARSPAPELRRLSFSARSSWRLAPYDLAGSRAHARELRRAGLLEDDELGDLLSGIDALAEDVRSGAFVPSEEDEDLHTALERALVERLGSLGGKLRAGRSRNDQAVTELRLYLRDAARDVAEAIIDMEEALVGRAYEQVRTVAPGFTHLQPAQPISFGHLLAAHAQAFARDLERLRDWDRRAAYSPLGAAALAGSTIAMHPELSAQELGFTAPCPNSIDAVADRDFVAEFLFAAAQTGVHLSRLGEEICLWSSRQFAWIELDDAYATGSSIMPQKKNPDIAELARGASGPLIGNLTALLALVKGLPLAYDRDLSFDKHEVLDSVDLLLDLLPAVAGLLRTMRIDAQAIRAEAERGFTVATDVADWLARRNVPFREAHEIVGRLVRSCEEQGRELDSLENSELAAVDPRLIPEVRAVLSVEHALEARHAVGATAPERVLEQLAALREKVDGFAGWARQRPGPVSSDDRG